MAQPDVDDFDVELLAPVPRRRLRVALLSALRLATYKARQARNLWCCQLRLRHLRMMGSQPRVCGQGSRGACIARRYMRPNLYRETEMNEMMSWQGTRNLYMGALCFSCLLHSSLELSDTKVYEPEIRALLGTWRLVTWSRRIWIPKKRTAPVSCRKAVLTVNSTCQVRDD